jgi:hypothetical protein
MRNNHPDMPQKQPGNTNPAEWVSDLHEANDLYLDAFELFANKLHTMYEDNHRRLNSVTKAIKEYQHMSNEAV